MFTKNNYKKGFTLVEIIISVSILSIIFIVVGSFMKDIFTLNFTLRGDMNAQIDGRHIVKVMVRELRESSQSNLGAYPINLASSTGVTFYSDIDGDGFKDKVRYFLSGKSIKKGVIPPSGNPLVYKDTDEKITTVISNVVASSTLPIFQYYPSSYSGSGSPLTQPVSVSSVRLVKITVIIDSDPNHSPSPMIFTSQVSIRNLKDNL